MKKLLAVLSVAALMTGFAACGGGASSDKDKLVATFTEIICMGKEMEALAAEVMEDPSRMDELSAKAEEMEADMEAIMKKHFADENAAEAAYKAIEDKAGLKEEVRKSAEGQCQASGEMAEAFLNELD